MSERALVGTRKGLLVLQKKGANWKIIDDFFTGIPVNMVYQDTQNGDWWAALDHGHWGSKLQVSSDEGKTWTEVEAPKYPEGAEVKDGVPAKLNYIWAFANSLSGADHKLYIGTEPGGLFHRNGSLEDGAHLVQSLWDHPSRKEQWFGGGRDNPGIHSILIDPRNNEHIYIGISCAGVFKSEDGGSTWTHRNKGLNATFLPDPEMEIGHDPHILKFCAAHPDVMWQQNHCGIFRTTNGGELWQEVSQEGGPAFFGFALAVHEENPERAWVAPAQSDEIRVAIDKKLCISRTDDGGKTWTDFRAGLPQEHCYDIVYRHALVSQGNDLLFGTTTGNLFSSTDEGESWDVVSNYLPMIYCIEFIE